MHLQAPWQHGENKHLFYTFWTGILLVIDHAPLYGSWLCSLCLHGSVVHNSRSFKLSFISCRTYAGTDLRTRPQALYLSYLGSSVLILWTVGLENTNYFSSKLPLESLSHLPPRVYYRIHCLPNVFECSQPWVQRMLSRYQLPTDIM